MSYSPTGTTAGTAAAGNDTRITGAATSGALAAETSRAEAAEALLLPLAGGTVTGALTVNGELTQGGTIASTGAAGFKLPINGPMRPVPYRVATWAQLFQTGHGWTTSGAGIGSGSNLNDTSTFIKGTQCATVVTAGNGSQAALSLVGGTSQNLTNKMIRLTFNVADITHLQTLAFYVGSGSLGSNFVWQPFTSTPSSLNWVQSGEWVSVCISWADLYGSAGYTISAAGAPSTRTGFTDMRFAIYDDGTGQPVTVHLQAVEILPDTGATFPNGVCSITFDDSYENVYTLGRPIMDTYGQQGTLYTIQDQVGQSGCLTLPQLLSVQNFSGWEVAGHAYTLAAHNAGYQTLTADQVNTELRNLKAWLVSSGFPTDSFAYPNGEFAATTDNVPVDQIVSQYFATGRTIVSEVNEVWPPPMPMRLKCITGVSSFAGGVPVSSIVATGGALERCAQQGAWLQIALHQIVTATPTATTQLLQSDFQALMAAISSYGMPVLPVSTVTRFYS